MSRPIGQFLFVVSLVVLVIFYATNQAEAPAWGFLCAGLPLFVLGTALMWIGRNPPEESGRFRTLRRARTRKAEKRKK